MAQAKAAWVDFKAIKSQVSIVQILERYGVLQSLAKSGNGDRMSGACPIHGGTNKTHFRVSASKNCWNCFGKCQSGGNVIDFVAKKEGIEFRDAALLIQKWFPNAVSAQPPEVEEPAQQVTEAVPTVSEDSPRQDETPVVESAEADQPHRNPTLKFALNKLDATHPYLRERGLTEETIATFGLGYCGKGLLRGYIAIPIQNTEGELVAYAGRWPGMPGEGVGKYKLPQGFKKNLELFNQHRAAACDNDAPLVVVEGYFDAIKLHQAGYERVVALMGSSLSADQEECIVRLCKEDGRVILFLDNDEAGRKGQADALARLSKRLYAHTVHLGNREVQPEHLSSDELRALLPFPEGRFP
ncbi:MAG: CHC2 zinc finger domain-containing protein [Verrucomicrobiota bacterium]